MKNVFKTIFFIMLTLTLLISLASCKKCKHTKTQTVAECLIDATETSEGSYDEVVYCVDCAAELERTFKIIPKLRCTHIDDDEDFACDKCKAFFVGENHTVHIFDRKESLSKYLVSEANCTSPAVYYMSCGCGEVGTETYSDGLPRHTFEDRIAEEHMVSEATCAGPAVYFKSCECGERTSITFKGGERLSHVFENDICTLCSEPKRYVRSGDYIYFGEYPQTIKAKGVEITNIPSSSGVYIGTDGERYMKVEATPYHTNADYLGKFSNGEAIIPGETYYFKLEPIKWRIFIEEDYTVLLCCETIIANMAFDREGECDYFKSDLYEWFNGEFLNTAFDETEREIIIERTTKINSNTIYTDSVYTLTEKELKEIIGDYRFSIMTSDYARATGVYFANYTDYYTKYGVGAYWTSGKNYDGQKIELIGKSNAEMPDTVWGGVRPIVKIELR